MIYRTSPSTGWVVAASASGALLKTQNLSDLDNVSTARSNLGLGDLATQNNVDLASDVTGQLPVANGGTGASSASDARSNLGLGSIATQASDNVSITGGAISGITDLAVADGGTGASDASGARTNLGLVIGSDVQAFNQSLADIAGISQSDGTFIVSDGTNFVAESGSTARASLGLGSAAVENVGTSREDLVQAASSLTSNQVVSIEVVDQTTLSFTSPGSNWNYIYAGSNWSGPNSSAGSIVSKSGDTSAGTLVISFSSGSASDFNTSGGDTFQSSGYSFTTASASSTSVTGLKTNSQSELRGKIGDATAAATSSSATKGLASFDSAVFSASSGFISIDTGIGADDVMKLNSAVTAGHLVKAQTLPTISGSANASTSMGSTTVTTATDVTSALSGQTVSFDSGYTFTLASSPVVDPNNSSQYIMTMTSSTNLNYAAYSGASFTINGGDGFASAGVAGNAANLDVATGVGSSAQGKLLKVSGSASLAADSLLAINASGEIIAGSAGEQGTVTSIALADDDGDDTTAVTTSGAIVVKGGGSNGAISTNVNGSGELEVIVEDASTSQKGVLAFASSSNYSNGTHVAGVAISSGADLGANKFITLNSSAQIETFVPTHYGIDGPIVKSCTGIASSVTMPSTIGALEGAYIVNDSTASADVSVALPTSVSASDIGATVTFKVQDLNGQKMRISGGVVSGGARMTIDGADFVDLDQSRQSVTLHLGAVLGSTGQSVDALCWSIL